MKTKVNPAMLLTMKLVYAAGHDAGNRSMRSAGRTKWSRADYNAAATEFARLAPCAVDCNPAMRAAILAEAR